MPGLKIQKQDDNIFNNNSKENKPQEIGGYNGPEPTIYGDWQHNGKVTDF